jgi:glycosyltransferase involved in cell wall biosynthesis
MTASEAADVRREPPERLSLIIATADRSRALSETLHGLAGCELPVPELHVVVADNGADPGTRAACDETFPGLLVEHVPVSRRGKTIALNRAVSACDSDLIAFTDDDVEFHPKWLAELVDATRAWPGHLLFGGRVLPLWPADCPARLVGSAFLGPLYTRLDWGDGGGPRERFRPFGPNMMVRREAFDRGVLFDEAIGPGSATGISMGDEVDFALQLEAMGEMAVYVPLSRVYHMVRKDQLTLLWQLKRGVAYGRSRGYGDGPPPPYPRWFGLPRWLYRKAASDLVAAGRDALRGDRCSAFDRLMVIAVDAGKHLEANRT